MIGKMSEAGKPFLRQGITYALPVIAIAISVVALTLALMERSDIRREKAVEATPKVVFETATDMANMPIGISLTNQGSALAEVRNISYWVDGKMVGNVEQAMDSVGLEDQEYFEFEKNDILGVGQIRWLLSESTNPTSRDEQKSVEHFKDVLEHHLAVGAEACSIFTGKCYRICSVPQHCE
jgi:hypothetical protein